MKWFYKKYIVKILLATIIVTVFPVAVMAQTVTTTPPIITVNAMDLLPRTETLPPTSQSNEKSSAVHVEISPSPRFGSFEEGSTFQVPILLNTRGTSINGIEVYITFDKNKLSVVQQSNGISIIGIWVEAPRYDNTKGTASYIGVVPNGIITGSGAVGNITFKAIGVGQATVDISVNSRILQNDGLGTKTILDIGRGTYTILPKAPEGVRIYSETHPFQNTWYNNNSPIVSWDTESAIDGFSYTLDNKPGTIPDNKIRTTDTTTSFTDLADGLWYFHIKAHKAKVWGNSGQFLVRIDTTPPADFKPEVSYLMAAAVLTERTLISFFTTDNLSGIDHYEVGIIDKAQPATESPVFVQAESPYQVPLIKNANLRVIVRAIDKAGNIRDAFVDIKPSNIFGTSWQDSFIWILLLILLLIILAFIVHYLFGHRILKRFERAFSIAKQEEQNKEAKEISPSPPEATNILSVPYQPIQPIQPVSPLQEINIPLVPQEPVQPIKQQQAINIPPNPLQSAEVKEKKESILELHR